MNTPFVIEQSFFCQWTGGSKKLFETMQEAIDEAKKMYVRKPNMTDENFCYWLQEKQIIGKVVTITQVLEEVNYSTYK